MRTVSRLHYRYLHTMEYLYAGAITFCNFPLALEAVEVTFQKANRPSGNMQEVKRNFSGKHNLYGFKVEVLVRL